MHEVTDRDFRRPTLVGTMPCPGCGYAVTTEDDGHKLSIDGRTPFHAECIPPELKPCGACGELEELRRLDSMGHCWRCKCRRTAETKSPAA